MMYIIFSRFQHFNAEHINMEFFSRSILCFKRAYLERFKGEFRGDVAQLQILLQNNSIFKNPMLLCYAEDNQPEIIESIKQLSEACDIAHKIFSKSQVSFFRIGIADLFLIVTTGGERGVHQSENI